jgi:hypothetical protein
MLTCATLFGPAALAAVALAGPLRAADPDPLTAARDALEKKRQAREDELQAAVDACRAAVKKRKEGAKADLRDAEAALAEWKKTRAVPLGPLDLAAANVGSYGPLLSPDQWLEARSAVADDRLAVARVTPPTRPMTLDNGNGKTVTVGGSPGGKSRPFVLAGVKASDYATGSRLTSMPGVWVITRTQKLNGKDVFLVEQVEGPCRPSSLP